MSIIDGARHYDDILRLRKIKAKAGGDDELADILDWALGLNRYTGWSDALAHACAIVTDKRETIAMASRRLCKYCFYWRTQACDRDYLDAYWVNPSKDRDHTVRTVLGNCKRNAPRMNNRGEVEFPKTYECDDCGDWTPDHVPVFTDGMTREQQVHYAQKVRERWLAEKAKREADLVESLGPWYNK